MFHIGDLLVTALECAPSVMTKRVNMNKSLENDSSLERYRHIMTILSDKSSVEEIQQRLCRRLAEVLLRNSFESSYSIAGGSSPAINDKSKDLK